MKTIIGFTLIVLGILVGLFAGVGWAFIGGLVAIFTHISPPDAGAIVLGILRVMFAGLIGWACALVFVVPGLALIK